ncbi:heme NO-binding domain-containing protein [Mariniblastus fucicola]|uniref:Heme NO binding protein n=1 Tax=Mariniblastus fucicola TaxID=980251 RepID=A0A5B9PCX9_9BACT|nr:heme NO-binding domain-containing protein [Mariniblastus fucicola]QEG23025.1 Heme NO binding protein [Mariniblastus fucicola]
MKGVIFTEFLGFIEDQFGLAMADQLITETNPESGGSYTSVGTYDAGELVAMVVKLGEKTGSPVPDLVKAFGSHLFSHFVDAHSATLGDVKTTEELLSQVENRIHVEVRKLFPDAELPTIGFLKIDEKTSEVVYQSKRPFADLAEGLIAAAIEHFDDPIEMTREDLPPGDGSHAKFLMRRE